MRLAAPHLGKAAAAVEGGTLAPLFSAGPQPHIELRRAATAFLTGTSYPELLHAAVACKLRLPTAVEDYTDFYAYFASWSREQAH